MKVVWQDVREDYARKDAQILELKEKNETPHKRVQMLISLLSFQNAAYYNDEINDLIR